MNTPSKRSHSSTSTAWLCCLLLLSTTNTVGAYKRHSQLLSTTVSNSITSTSSSSTAQHRLSPTFLTVATSRRIHPSSSVLFDLSVNLPRGGASSDSEEEEDDDSDSDSEDEEVEEEAAVDDDSDSDSEEVSDEEETEEEEDDDVDEEASEDGVQIDMAVQKYDEPLFPSPFANLYVTFGVMFLARKLDLKSPKAAIIARIAYISYIVILQLFLAYVRIQAKATDDRTPVSVSNPFSSVLQGQMEGMAGGGGGMMKMLASSLLSSTTSVLEYDLKEAKNMQRGLLFNMAFQWFLHFKMKQVQPLLIQTGSGLLNLYYSPLFQVYVLGRNLERPFKLNTTSMAKLQELQKAQAEAAQAGAEEAETEAIASSTPKLESTEPESEATDEMDEDDASDNDEDAEDEDDSDTDEDSDSDDEE